MWSRRSLLLWPPLAVLIATLPPASVRAQKVWKTYRNERFGTAIEYPSDRFRPLPPPANGDGLGFEAGDGARFSVSGGFNVFERSLIRLRDFYLEDRDAAEQITYRTQGLNW